jgi:DNA-binding NarL/FixJ family response regulator
VLDVLASVLALWLTHPLSPVAPPSLSTGQTAWSLALTERQVSIMRRVEQGWSTRGIAIELGLSESTVKQDVQHVMRNMRTSDRRTAAARARTLGLM